MIVRWYKENPKAEKEKEKQEKKWTSIFPFSNVFVFKRLYACTNTFITFYDLEYGILISMGR